MSKIASTVFGGGPTDNIAVADVYDKPSVDLLSSAATGVKTISDSAFTSIRNTGMNLGDLSRMLTVKDGKITITKDEATKRLNSMIGVPIVGIGGLSQSAQISAIGKMGEMAGIPTNTLTTAAGQIVRVTQGVNAQNAQGLMNALSAVLGNDLITQFVDTTAEVAFLTTILDYSIQWGIADAIDTIMDKLEYSKEAKVTLTGGFSTAVYNGDLTMLAKIIEAAGRDQILALYPNAVGMILMGYSFPMDAKPAEYPAILTQYLSILNMLNPNWSKTTRNGVWVNNLEPFITASSDSRTLLSNDDNYWDLVLMAPNYPTQDAMALVRMNYPMVVVRR